MRVIVACLQCGRQYDAKGRRAGTRFRCHCGAVVTVKRPKGHDASVVRCSSCGAPREEGNADCRFCGSDFTLHERDLETVCPKCLARVSDRARFCHYCGIRLMPEDVASDKTPLICPACGGAYRLGNRRIGEVSVLECNRCAGLWLGSETFKQLAERASSDDAALDRLFESTHVRSARPGVTDQKPQAGWRYRKCPTCGGTMYRRNFGRRSGVIVDICKDHGVWFDADELPRILDWIRSGESAKAKEELAAQEARQEHMKRITQRPERGPVIGTPLGGPDEYPSPGPGDFLYVLMAWLSGLR